MRIQFMSAGSFPEKMDRLIRGVLYGLVIFLPYSISAVEICVVLSLILWIIKRGALFHRDRQGSWEERLRKHFCLPATYLNPFIGLFLLAGLFSVAGGVMPLHSLKAFFTKTVEWFVIYFLVIEVFREKAHFYRVTTLMLITAGATALDAILQYHVLGKSLFRGHSLVEGHRATAGFGHSNGLGSFLTTMILIALSRLKGLGRAVPWKKIFYLSYFIILVWALVLTFSRGSWIIFVLGILLFTAFYNRNKMRKISLAFILIIAVMGPLLIGSENLKEEFRLTSANVETTVHWRWGIWAQSVEMIKQRPVTGFGLNTYMTVFQDYRWDSHFGPTYAHNCFIQTAVETGLVGLSAFLALLGAVVVRNGRLLYALRASLKDRSLALIFLGVYCAVAGFVIHAAVETNFYSLQLSALFWVLAGLLTPLGTLVRQDLSKGEGL